MKILMLPGWTGSGPDHWQSRWERQDSRMERVEQADWDNPVPDVWTATLEARVRAARERVVLVAHSCGVSALQRWARPGESRVAGAFLVAPPDPELADAPTEVSGFGAMSANRLPFPALLVASRNDPYCAFSRAQLFARNWGAELIDVGESGHINSASGHGPWPEGRKLLADFVGWWGSVTATAQTDR